MKSRSIITLGLLAAAAGCDIFDNALSVQSPTNIPAGGLEKPSNALPLVNGAIAHFECGAGAYVVIGGLIGDELIDATQKAAPVPYQRPPMLSSDRPYALTAC